MQSPIPDLLSIVRESARTAEPNKWPTYNGDFLVRDDFVTASDAGKCERSIWFDKNRQSTVRFGGTMDKNVSPPEGNVVSEPTLNDGWGYFARGHNVEAWYVEELRKAGVKVFMGGTDQRSFHYGVMSGTPDGVLITPEGEYVLLEIKSIDPRTNLRYLPKAAHITQVQQNTYLVNHCTGFKITRGLIVYIDASDYSQQTQHTVDYDHEYVLELKKRAVRIMSCSEAEEMSPVGLYDGTCRLCDHGARCTAAVQRKKETTDEAVKRRNTSDKFFR